MPLIKEPLKVNCYHCQQSLLIKYVVAKKTYSHKNDWAYWTGNPAYQGQYRCNKCLLKLYKKDKWKFHQEITNPKLKQLFRKYVWEGSIG